MVRKSDKMQSKFIGLFVIFLFLISICSSFAAAAEDNETKVSFQDYISGFFDKIKSIFTKNIEKNTKEAVDETVDEVIDEQTSESTEESSKMSLLDKVMNLVKESSFIYIIIGIAIFIILAKLISAASEMFGKLLLVVLIILVILALYRYLF
jgi:hypothetical protein